MISKNIQWKDGPKVYNIILLYARRRRRVDIAKIKLHNILPLSNNNSNNLPYIAAISVVLEVKSKGLVSHFPFRGFLWDISCFGRFLSVNINFLFRNTQKSHQLEYGFSYYINPTGPQKNFRSMERQMLVKKFNWSASWRKLIANILVNTYTVNESANLCNFCFICFHQLAHKPTRSVAVCLSLEVLNLKFTWINTYVNGTKFKIKYFK